MTYALESLLAMTPAERVRPFRHGWSIKIHECVETISVPTSPCYCVVDEDGVQVSVCYSTESDAWAAAAPSAEEIMQCADECTRAGYSFIVSRNNVTLSRYVSRESNMYRDVRGDNAFPEAVKIAYILLKQEEKQ